MKVKKKSEKILTVDDIWGRVTFLKGMASDRSQLGLVVIEDKMEEDIKLDRVKR